MRNVDPGQDTVGGDGYGKGHYGLELLEKGKSLFTICTASRGAEVKAAGDKTLTRRNILQHVWMLSLWLQKVPQPSSWNKI